MEGLRLCRLALALTVVTLIAWPPGAGNAGEAKVYASNYPLAYFAERIGGRPDIVHFPRIDGDPAFWRPSAEDVIAMQDAAVILLNGAGYEKWLNSVSLPRARLVDTAAGFRDRHMAGGAGVKHTHGTAGDHVHGDTAFTTWIDFTQAAEQAEAVRRALLRAGIAPEPELNGNFEALRAELLRIDRRLAEITSRLAETPVIGSHPVYQYLARRYGLDLESVHWEPDSFPSPEMWADLETLQRGHPARWMIWEGPPLARTVERLEAMGVRSVVFDPAGNRPEAGDFLTVMDANIENIRTIGESGDF